MKSVILLLIALMPLLSAAAPTPAGHDQGNGGDAVLIDGKYYLLDLLEAGVEKNPFIDMKIKTRPDFLKRLEVSLPPGFPHELIGRKLTEIHSHTPLMAHILLKTIEAYQWKIVNSSLLDIIDENTNLAIPRKKLFQLAVRKSSSILVDRNLWLKLDEGNRTALVFHEVLYALAPPLSTGLLIRAGYPALYQASETAREINGYLFSDLPRQGAKGLERFRDFAHIIGYPFNMPDNFRGVDDSGGSVLINPYAEIKISETFYNVVTRPAFQLGVEIPNADSENLITKACSFAVAEGAPLALNVSEGSGVYLGLSSFESLAGPRTYMSVLTHWNKTPPILNKKFQSQEECLQTLRPLVYAHIESINERYK